MELTCPKCKSEDTQKLTLVTDKGLFGKMMRFGAVYVYNIWIPVASVFFGIAFGIAFGMFNGYLGFFAFVGILAAGYFARKWVKTKRLDLLKFLLTLLKLVSRLKFQNKILSTVIAREYSDPHPRRARNQAHRSNLDRTRPY